MKLPPVGTILVRTEAPTVLYRVTSVHGKGTCAYARLLPYRRSGTETAVTMVGKLIVGNGSVWQIAE